MNVYCALKLLRGIRETKKNDDDARNRQPCPSKTERTVKKIGQLI